MRIRTKYILFIIILHSIAVILSYFIFQKNKLLFIASEIFILMSLIISAQIYNQLIRPLQLLQRSAQAIKDRDFNIKLVLTGQSEMDDLINVYNQMTDALRIERIKQKQHHFFVEKIIETSPTGILILDFDDKIQQVNPRALHILGMDVNQLIDQPVDSIDHPLLLPIKGLPPETSTTVTVNGVNTFKLQKPYFVDRGFTRHFVTIEELTEEIRTAEKKAYGKVIRMMAHEVNNTIGPVNSIIQSALTSNKIWEKGEHHALHDALQVAFDRNRNLTIFMRNFTDVVRLPNPKKNTFDLHQLILANSKFLEMMANGKQISINYQLDQSPFLIVADQQQMEQVFINVVKNSVEAISNQGEISIYTHRASWEMIISDNGKGIDPQQSPHLFTPFFSTKRDGQGIGLTLVKEILINHNVEFSLESSGGKTSFVFDFSKTMTPAS